MQGSNDAPPNTQLRKVSFTVRRRVEFGEVVKVSLRSAWNPFDVLRAHVVSLRRACQPLAGACLQRCGSGAGHFERSRGWIKFKLACFLH